MNEEQLLILKMVEDGRITAEQGGELLDALSDKEDPKTNKVGNEGWRRLERQGEEFAQKVESAVEKLSKTLEQKMEGGLAEKLSGLPKLLSKIPFVTVIGEESHVFEDEFSGTFKQDMPNIPVKLHTIYGGLTVEGWQQDRYKLVVKQKIPGKNRDTALQQVIGFDIPERDDQVEKLEISAPEQRDVHISYHLYLPAKNLYMLELKSRNGKCFLENLQAENVKVRTNNGSITVKHLKANQVEAITSNGACVFDDVVGTVLKQRTANGGITCKGSARKIECESTNGSVRVQPLSFISPVTDINLKTINGSIYCHVAKQPELNIKVNAHTAMGKVQIGLDSFVDSQNQRSAASHQVKGQVEGVGNEVKVVNIDAQVSSGSITIVGKEENDGSR